MSAVSMHMAMSAVSMHLAMSAVSMHEAMSVVSMHVHNIFTLGHIGQTYATAYRITFL